MTNHTQADPGQIETTLRNTFSAVLVQHDGLTLDDPEARKELLNALIEAALPVLMQPRPRFTRTRQFEGTLLAQITHEELIQRGVIQQP